WQNFRMRHWIKPLATLFALPLATLLAVMLFPAFFLIPSRDGTETHAVVRETLRWLSLALLTAGATHLVLGKALSLYARRSRDTLVKAFRAAWSLTV
uniref:hypothetical protein n=1 Tax=Escherichia coli TaxID=562 RepID=UPI00278BCB5A